MERGIAVAAVVQGFTAGVAHGAQVVDEAAGVGSQLDLPRDGDAEAVRLLPEEVGVVAA